MPRTSCWTISGDSIVELLIASFTLIFVSMLGLVAAQLFSKGDLPTGCTPDGCRRCKKDCPSKASLDAQTGRNGG